MMKNKAAEGAGWLGAKGNCKFGPERKGQQQKNGTGVV